MCAICNSIPCKRGCPNAEEPVPEYRCKICGEGIFSGDKYLQIGGERICEMCVENMPTDELLDLFGERLITA